MLVLSRKVSERIRIGNDIVVSVTQIGRTSVRLAIEAPKNVLIMRDELPPAVTLKAATLQESAA